MRNRILRLLSRWRGREGSGHREEATIGCRSLRASSSRECGLLVVPALGGAYIEVEEMVAAEGQESCSFDAQHFAYLGEGISF